MEFDTAPSQSHPNPQPSIHTRKIELQSPPDLTYLQNNLAKSALARLDLHIPPIEPAPKPATIISLGGPSDPASNSESVGRNKATEVEDNKNQTEQPKEDEEDPNPLRTRVQALLSQFLHQTWTAAQSNLTLNGLDATTLPIPHTATLSPAPPPPSSTSPTELPIVPLEKEGIHYTYQPFDPRLSHKLASLHASLEKLTAEVSALRRSAPQKSATTYSTTLTQALQSEDAAHESSLHELKSTESGLDLKSLQPRHDWNDTSETYDLALNELGTLAGTNNDKPTSQDNNISETNGGNTRKRKATGPSLTETMGKVQRAMRVAAEME